MHITGLVRLSNTIKEGSSLAFDTIQIVSEDTLTDLTTPYYLDDPDIIRDFYMLWGTDFDWYPSDLIHIYYSPDKYGFFKYDEPNRCFTKLED